MLEAFAYSSAYRLDVVVAGYQIDGAIQPIQDIGPFPDTAHGEVSQMKDDAIWRYYTVPVGYHRLIHLFHIAERPLAEGHDVGMAEMSIGSKEEVIFLEFEVLVHIVCKMFPTFRMAGDKKKTDNKKGWKIFADFPTNMGSYHDE